jgi:hypothetical protein
MPDIEILLTKGIQMVRRKMRNFFGAFAVFLAIAQVSHAAIISGTSTMKLNSPATPEIRNEAVTIAADSLKRSLLEWIARSAQVAINLKNPIEKHFFNLYARSCIKNAKQDSYFEGRNWSLNLDIKGTETSRLLNEHNGQCLSKAEQYWGQALKAIEAKQHVAIYSNCINALFYSIGYIGKPEAEKNIELHARKVLQDFMGTLKINYSTPIIKGKLGEISPTAIDIKATVGEQPFQGLTLLARLPDGRRITKITTDTQGAAKLANIKMPFVAYGTFLHVIPDFGATVNSNYSFEAPAFGIKLEQSQDQTLIFNIKRPTYSLNYRATAANQVQIPADFSNDRGIRKFLQDSCHLKQMTAGEPADIAIEIQCQVSSYSFDDREETDLKAEVQASIKQLAVGGGSAEKIGPLYKKTYDTNHPIPTGLFFWEATNALKALIKDMLHQL